MLLDLIFEVFPLLILQRLGCMPLAVLYGAMTIPRHISAQRDQLEDADHARNGDQLEGGW